MNGRGGEASSEPPQKKPSVDYELESIDDALAYLKKVKDTMFKDKKEEYDELMNAMEDAKANTIVAAVNDVFEGLEDLVSGFNNFIQKECEVKLPLEDELPQGKPLPKFQEVLNFVGKVRSHFEGNNDVFMSFVDIMKLYNKKLKSLTDAYDEIVSLLIDHKDLLDNFTGFFTPS